MTYDISLWLYKSILLGDKNCNNNIKSLKNDSGIRSNSMNAKNSERRLSNWKWRFILIG